MSKIYFKGTHVMRLVSFMYIYKSRFSDPDRSLNRKRERFKVFEVQPRSNRG